MNEKDTVLYQMEQAELAYSGATAQRKWDLAQSYAEIMMNCARRLHLMQQVEARRTSKLLSRQ